MRDEDLTGFRPVRAKNVDPEGGTVTETIDLDSLFTKHLTSSGSFDITGGIWATTFGKVLQALPIPAMLIDESYHVVVSNQACRKISPGYEKIHGEPFAALFIDNSGPLKAISVVEAVFSSRKPRILESFLEIEGNKIWGRITFRAIRIAEKRLVLALIEDLTLERKRSLQDKKHKEDLEKLVKERTSKLERVAEQLRLEIIERRQAEERLRRSKETIEALLNATSDMAFLLGADGTFLAANQQVAKWFRTDCSDLLGKSLFGLAPAGLAGVEKTQFHRVIRSGKPLRFQAEQFGKFYDNNLYPVLDFLGAVIAVAVYIRDISTEKKTNELLMHSARVKAVGDMASGVAHNFNNLLQIIMNAAYEVSADLELNDIPEARSKIKRIIKSAAAGADTVRRLQDFAHARTDDAAASGKVFDLSSTVEQTIEILKPYWKTNPEKHGIRISLQPNLSKDCLVRGKENEMFEVVLNLVKNAVEALPEGGEIQISTYVESDYVHLCVEDNGVGIAEGNLERIFEPFWSTKGVDGIGMGLASSYGIVRRHEGEIFAERTPDRRTVFTVRLPLEEKETEGKLRPQEQRAQIACRILIIDDSEDSVWALQNGLTRAGQEVLASLSGHQGIELFKNEKVDVVICDLGMPGLNGWDVAKAVKEISLERGIPKPPFILLTGWAGLLQEKAKLLECGIDRIVEKPFLALNLLEIVRDLLDGQGQAETGPR
ncbi:MAG: ATP-binding protein [Desulfomonilaceae bacterium]